MAENTIDPAVVEGLRLRAQEIRADVEKTKEALAHQERELFAVEEVLRVWGEPLVPPTAQPIPTSVNPLPPLPQAIVQVLKDAGRALNHEAIKSGLVESGFSKDDLGAYYYKTMARLRKSNRIRVVGEGFTA